MYLCFESPLAIQCFLTEVNRRLIFCKHRFVARTTSYAVTLRSEIFAGSIFLFLTADILQEYLGLWCGDWLHVSFAKCGATFTSVATNGSRRKKSNLLSKVPNTNKSNESVHFYHHGSKAGLIGLLSTWMLI